jgi:2-keto-4-pentenoate hydratase/2-oxohepta-3-ene-1,7-dioic acid hydratase in catechol pathway
MKLVRYTVDGEEGAHAGILAGDGDEVVGAEEDSLPELLEIAASQSGERTSELSDGSVTDRQEAKVLCPVAPDRRLFCLGGVYTGHLEDAGLSVMVDPNQWVIPQSAIIGPEEPIVLPESVEEKVMPAAELCIVVGKSGKYIDPTKAYDYIAGYTVSNDVTARTDWPGPMGYKMMDTFSPVGPFVRTADEVTCPGSLGIEMRQDDEVICEGSTAGMRFTLSFMLSYVSTVTRLRPGDVISTGDPGGVTQPLRPSSTVEVEIEGVGRLENEVVSE